MKGTPEIPQCGFSRASIQILGLQGVDPAKFSAFNVLEDEELRAGEDIPSLGRGFVRHRGRRKNRIREKDRTLTQDRYQGIFGVANDTTTLREQGIRRGHRYHDDNASRRQLSKVVGGAGCACAGRGERRRQQQQQQLIGNTDTMQSCIIRLWCIYRVKSDWLYAFFPCTRTCLPPEVAPSPAMSEPQQHPQSLTLPSQRADRQDDVSRPPIFYTYSTWH